MSCYCRNLRNFAIFAVARVRIGSFIFAGALIMYEILLYLLLQECVLELVIFDVTRMCIRSCYI